MESLSAFSQGLPRRLAVPTIAFNTKKGFDHECSEYHGDFAVFDLQAW